MTVNIWRPATSADIGRLARFRDFKREDWVYGMLSAVHDEDLRQLCFTVKEGDGCELDFRQCEVQEQVETGADWRDELIARMEWDYDRLDERFVAVSRHGQQLAMKVDVLQKLVDAGSIPLEALYPDSPEWRSPAEEPGDGDSIWIAVREHDGVHIHVDYAVAFRDVDGLLTHRYEGEEDGYGELWPPKDLLAWKPCEVPEYLE